MIRGALFLEIRCETLSAPGPARLGTSWGLRAGVSELEEI